MNLNRVAIQSAMFDNFTWQKGMRFLINIYFRIYIKAFIESVVARENTGLSEVRLELKRTRFHFMFHFIIGVYNIFEQDFRVDCKVPFMGEQLKLIDTYALVSELVVIFIVFIYFP